MPRNDKQADGFTLLLTVALVGAVGLTIGLLGRHVALLNRMVTGVTLDVRAEQLLASGRDWAAAHSERLAALGDDQTLELSVDDLGPPGSTFKLGIIRAQSSFAPPGVRQPTREGGDSAPRAYTARSEDDLRPYPAAGSEINDDDVHEEILPGHYLITATVRQGKLSSTARGTFTAQ